MVTIRLENSSTRISHSSPAYMADTTIVRIAHMTMDCHQLICPLTLETFAPTKRVTSGLRNSPHAHAAAPAIRALTCMMMMRLPSIRPPNRLRNSQNTHGNVMIYDRLSDRATMSVQYFGGAKRSEVSRSSNCTALSAAANRNGLRPSSYA